MRWLVRIAVAVVAVAAGCKARELLCLADTDCVGESGDLGSCLDRHCAFFDPNCIAELRFDDSAGDVKDQCVSPSLIIDAGFNRRDAGVRRDGGPSDGG